MSNAMNINAVSFYGRMEYTKGTETPKYVLTKAFGDYEPINALIGRDGFVSVFLTEKTNPDNTDAPTMRLQGKASLNISGLKNYFVDGGKVSKASYGTPPKGDTYGGKKPRSNPFASHATDGFIFLLGDVIQATNNDGKAVEIPSYIEWLIIPNASRLVGTYVSGFAKGGYSELLSQLRCSAAEWQR